MITVVVATDQEKELAKERFKHCRIIKTGVGPVNVMKALKHIPKHTKIINFGYAGSNKLPIGSEVSISTVSIYHENCEYESPIFQLNDIGYPCQTNNDFVLETDIINPVVFDMELAYICAMGFTRVRSIKIISDNLDYNKYEEVVS